MGSRVSSIRYKGCVEFMCLQANLPEGLSTTEWERGEFIKHAEDQKSVQYGRNE